MPIRVLHVDDDPSVQEITKLMLLDLNGGFEVDWASCVKDGFKKLASGHYDVVISDYEMPQKNGLEFLKELRESKNDIPFILFTGKGREEVAINALNLGANGYYNKQGSSETVYGELAYGILSSFEHRMANELLRKSQAELNAIVCNAPLGIATSDSNMLFRSANEAFCRIVGYSEDELQTLSFKDITYSEDVEISNEKMKELICGKILYFSQEKRYVRKDCCIIDGKATVSVIRDDEGKPVLFVAELEDITQRKQAEAELRGTFNVLERVGEGIDAGLAVIGKDYRVVWANKRMMALGVAPNKKCYETFNNLGAICPDCGVEKVFNQNVSLDVHEYQTVNSKGEITWVELRVTPLKDTNGKITAALELAVPITERKKKEQEIKSLARFPNENPFAVFRIDKTGTLLFANASAKSLLSSLMVNVGGFVPEHWRKLVVKVLESKRRLESEEKINESVFSFSFTPVISEGYVNIYSSDITQRKLAEGALRESEANYKNLINSMAESAWVIDFSGNFLEVNNAAVEVLGYSKEELFSIGIAGIDNNLSREHVSELIERLLIVKKQVFETVHTRKDGCKIPVEISSSLVTFQGKQAILSIARDVTERKKAEENLKEERNRIELLNEKLRVVGSLTRHDVGNKLMTAKSNVYLLKRRVGDNPELAKYFDAIDCALAASDRLFEFSRLYEKIGSEKLSKENVFESFNQAIALVKNLGNVQVVNECQGLQVIADSLLKQLFYNFIDNSLKHGEKLTQICLRYVENVYGLKLFYEDNGVGISEESKIKLFEAGFSTGKGSGLGLYLIKKMMDVYGWTITEEGEPGKGAKFIITIPELSKKGNENYQIAMQ